jgi:hypothetical protein
LCRRYRWTVAFVVIVLASFALLQALYGIAVVLVGGAATFLATIRHGG